MPTKRGMGGHGGESYDPATGKFVEDGHQNVRYDNPSEERKIKEHIAPNKIEEQSAAKQTAPTPNLGKYAKPGRGDKEIISLSRDEFLRIFNEMRRNK